MYPDPATQSLRYLHGLPSVPSRPHLVITMHESPALSETRYYLCLPSCEPASSPSVTPLDIRDPRVRQINCSNALHTDMNQTSIVTTTTTTTTGPAGVTTTTVTTVQTVVKPKESVFVNVSGRNFILDGAIYPVIG